MTDLDDLASELEEFDAPEKKGGRSAREERIIAGFEEIQRFVDEHGWVPEHGEDKDIFERIYAVRLDSLRRQPDCKALLELLDHQSLLTGSALAEDEPDELSDDELLAELEKFDGKGSLSKLAHVRSTAEIKAAEEIANRQRCEDFDTFKTLIQKAEAELKDGTRKTIRFGKDASIEAGDFYILGGQLVLVAEKGESFQTQQGHPDARLRVIYANGTESNLLLRSLQRALYKDEAGRRLITPDAGPLFRDTLSEDDVESGVIYVLRSLSDHPFVVEHRNLIHKIGVTGGKIDQRIANAENEATYLLAKVEVVASFKLAGVNRIKLENLIHRIFAKAQLDLTIHDRFGKPVQPREWFLVPLNMIEEAISRIMDGTIVNMTYDPQKAAFV